MKRVFSVTIALFVLVILTNVYADNLTSTFSYPVSPVGSSVEEYSTKELGFLQLNTNLPKAKYHLGEDWNKNEGGNSDFGDPVYAIAKGRVRVAEKMEEYDSIGKVIIIRHRLPSGIRVDSVYYHLKDVFVSENQIVEEGQIIGTIGDSNRFYLSSHLHFEIRTDLTLIPRTNPYVGKLALETAVKYSDPSLFIDDRKYQYTENLVKYWTYLNWHFNAPSSTAYIEHNGIKYSLPKAVEAGIIYKRVYVYIDGNWYYHPDITKVFFEAEKTYAIYSYVNGPTLNILAPGNNYPDNRARQDMINIVIKDTRFSEAKTETYYKYPEWEPEWELRWMRFVLKDGRLRKVYHATHKNNPLLRYVGFYDPYTGLWGGWKWVNWNRLD